MSLKTKSVHKNLLFNLASFFVLFSAVTLKSNSIVLWGEIECPEELLK